MEPHEADDRAAAAAACSAEVTSLDTYQPRHEGDYDLPTMEDFARQLRAAMGAPSLDGWESNELRALAKHFPNVLEELYKLWYDTTATAPRGLSEYVQCMLWSLRVVGVPNKDHARQPTHKNCARCHSRLAIHCGAKDACLAGRSVLWHPWAEMFSQPPRSCWP